MNSVLKLRPLLSIIALTMCIYTVQGFENQKISYLKKAGEVSTTNPANFSFKAKSDEVLIDLAKTGGEAQAELRIYVNNRLEKKMLFSKGKSLNTFKYSLKAVDGKTIKLILKNISKTNNVFKFRMHCFGQLPPPEGKVCGKKRGGKGSVLPNQPLRVENFTPICNTVRITGSRLRGRGAAVLHVKVDGQTRKRFDLPRGAGPTTKSFALLGVANQRIEIFFLNYNAEEGYDYEYEVAESEN